MDLFDSIFTCTNDCGLLEDRTVEWFMNATLQDKGRASLIISILWVGMHTKTCIVA